MRPRGKISHADAVRHAALATRLRMGVISTLSATHLVGDLQTLRASAPELDLDIRESHGEDLGEALEKGEIDVAIMTLSDCPDTLRAIPLYREPYRVAFAPRHRFGRMNAVPMRELMPRHLPLTSGLETRPVVEPEVHRTVSIVTRAGRPHSKPVAQVLQTASRFVWDEAACEAMSA